MVRSDARIPTSTADHYAKQLCKHATHMGANAEWTPTQGMVEFPQGGRCRITAGAEELVLTAEATTPDQLATIQAILTANLQRFGQRHGLSVNWCP
ncbi:MAG: DUF2218 domain-containing protein [Pseudonocardiales bacterium]|nr:MAG: DUF2218 domain-containing protein [Pseudonocardiales bacterium]